MGRRLALGPHALLQGTAQLGLMRLPDQVSALVVERRVEEEAVVVEREVLARLTDPALAERHQLLALGERAHGDSPFLEGNWHRWMVSSKEREGTVVPVAPRAQTHGRSCLLQQPADPRDGTVTYYAQSFAIAKYPCKQPESTYERRKFADGASA